MQANLSETIDTTPLIRSSSSCPECRISSSFVEGFILGNNLILGRLPASSAVEVTVPVTPTGQIGCFYPRIKSRYTTQLPNEEATDFPTPEEVKRTTNCNLLDFWQTQVDSKIQYLEDLIGSLEQLCPKKRGITRQECFARLEA